MKITLMYETQVEVVVDTLTLSVDSISVIHQLGSSIGGINGYISVSASEKGEHESFTRDELRCALGVVRTKRHPRWRFKEPV